MSEIKVESDISEPKPKRKVTVNKLVIENLDVNCEWKDCGLSFKIANLQFYNHVSSHLKVIDIDIDCDDEEFYVCGWATCKFNTKDTREVTRHVKYHAYHAELRALGNFVSESLNLPPCVVSSEFHVLTHVDDSQLVCLWKNCHQYCSGIHEFLDHVQIHLRYLSPGSKTFDCKWADCESSFKNKTKLNDHMKTHTKQHYIACAHCGHCFANKTKFADHCLTQKPLEEHIYQCDYCLSFHPTERLLRKHMAQHINHYKCPFCSMTCNKPSLLCKHIRFKHIDYRAFKCAVCNFKCVTKSDLQSHLMRHVTESQSCAEENCDFTATSSLLMKRHVDTVHIPNKFTEQFCCHICDMKFKRGVQLTKHLSSKHNLKKPPGYSRFLYRLEGDGYKRLQTVRLESMDIADVGELVECGSDEEKVDVAQENSDDTKVITVGILGEKGQILSVNGLFDGKSNANENMQIISIVPTDT